MPAEFVRDPVTGLFTPWNGCNGTPESRRAFGYRRNPNSGLVTAYDGTPDYSDLFATDSTGLVSRLRAQYDPTWIVYDWAAGYFQDGAGNFSNDPTKTFGANLTYTRTGPELTDDLEGVVRGPFADNTPAWTNGGVPLSPGATNLLLQSRTLTNAAWTTRGTATVTADMAKLRPDKTPGAMLFAGIQAVAVGDVFQNGLAVTLSARYEPSLDILRVSKTGTLGLNNPTNTNNGQWAVDMSLLPDGWTRITRDHPAVTILHEFIGAGAGDGLHLCATAGAPLSFYADYTQAELGQFSTGRIVTFGTTVTRGASVMTVAGWPSGAGTLVMFTKLVGPPPAAPVTIFDARVDASNEHALNYRAKSGGVNYTQNTVIATVRTFSPADVGTPTYSDRIAYSWDAAGGQFVANGASIGTSAVNMSGLNPTTLYVGSDATGAAQINGRVQRVILAPTRLSLSRMQSLTTS